MSDDKMEFIPEIHTAATDDEDIVEKTMFFKLADKEYYVKWMSRRTPNDVIGTSGGAQSSGTSQLVQQQLTAAEETDNFLETYLTIRTPENEITMEEALQLENSENVPEMEVLDDTPETLLTIRTPDMEITMEEALQMKKMLIVPELDLSGLVRKGTDTEVSMEEALQMQNDEIVPDMAVADVAPGTEIIENAPGMEMMEKAPGMDITMEEALEMEKNEFGPSQVEIAEQAPDMMKIENIAEIEDELPEIYLTIKTPEMEITMDETLEMKKILIVPELDLTDLIVPEMDMAGNIPGVDISDIAAGTELQEIKVTDADFEMDKIEYDPEMKVAEADFEMEKIENVPEIEGTENASEIDAEIAAEIDAEIAAEKEKTENNDSILDAKPLIIQ